MVAKKVKMNKQMKTMTFVKIVIIPKTPIHMNLWKLKNLFQIYNLLHQQFIKQFNVMVKL